MTTPKNATGTDGKPEWVPNLVGGASIWSFQSELNTPALFDGRLLAPEDIGGLTALADAESRWPEDVGAAIRDFKAALARVAGMLVERRGGLERYDAALTLPTLDAPGGPHYFYSRQKKKLYVVHWGASLGGADAGADHVLGWQDWGYVFAATSAPLASAPELPVALESKPKLPVALASAPEMPDALATGENPALPAADEEAPKKSQDAKPPAKPSAWWVWPLFVLLTIALLLVGVFVVRGWEPESSAVRDAGVADAGVARTAAAELATADAHAEAVTEDVTEDAATEDLADAATEEADDAAVADAETEDDGGTDAGRDAALALDDDDHAAADAGALVVQTFPRDGGTGARTAIHRRHDHPDAVAWRIASGTDKVVRTEQRGSTRFDVWLLPGKSFEGVRVEWQDRAGKWHPH